jgi:hypothetical protein
MKHGIDSTYRNRSCRCDECKYAHAEYARKYRKQTHSRYDIARRRVLTKLREDHPELYQQLLSESLAEQEQAIA